MPLALAGFSFGGYVAAAAAERLADAGKALRLVLVGPSTQKQQVPWESSSLTGAFTFNPGPKIASVAGTTVRLAPLSTAIGTRLFDASEVSSTPK